MEEITKAFGDAIVQDQKCSFTEEDLKKMKRYEVRRKVAIIGSKLRKHIPKSRKIQAMRKQEMIDFILKFKDLNLWNSVIPMGTLRKLADADSVILKFRFFFKKIFSI